VLTNGALRASKPGKWVMGTLVEVNATHSLGQQGAKKYSYQPIIEFAAPDGTTLRGEAGNYRHACRYPAGSQCKVLVEFDKRDMVVMSSWHRLAVGTF